jgi:putative Mn2+ efflux pump MntP
MIQLILYIILAGLILAIFLLAIIGATVIINALKNKNDN